MTKNIIFCADGTWNDPHQNDDHDALPDPTNVFKLFATLEGKLSAASTRLADEQELELRDDQGKLRQVAKYLHGVGDSRNPVMRVMGGAFGAGLISRIVRGYTYISRNYEDDDRIFLVGFSRGAYTARALAGLIAAQGLLRRELTVDREQAYRYGAEAWYRHRESALRTTDVGRWAHLMEVASDLPAFLSRGKLGDKDFVEVKQITAVAVWDTVGAMGLPEYDGAERKDAFKFADNKLHPKIRHGLHAISLDEQRLDFEPSLWEPDPVRIKQVVFPGAHADVGGGYPSKDQESGLSDASLDWMLAQLTSQEVIFAKEPPLALAPDPAGTAHSPWLHLPWNIPSAKLGARKLKGVAGLELHPSVQARCDADAVRHEPGQAPTKYRPADWPWA